MAALKKLLLILLSPYWRLFMRRGDLNTSSRTHNVARVYFMLSRSSCVFIFRQVLPVSFGRTGKSRQIQSRYSRSNYSAGVTQSADILKRFHITFIIFLLFLQDGGDDETCKCDLNDKVGSRAATQMSLWLQSASNMLQPLFHGTITNAKKIKRNGT